MRLTDELSLAAAGANAEGLGLTVAQALVERMGGELTYRRIRGESHLVLTLPAATEPIEPGATVHRFTLPRIVRPHVREDTHQPIA